MVDISKTIDLAVVEEKITDLVFEKKKKKTFHLKTTVLIGGRRRCSSEAGVPSPESLKHQFQTFLFPKESRLLFKSCLDQGGKQVLLTF